MSSTPGVEYRNLGDLARHLVRGKLTAFTGLRALGHFDLQLVRVDEVFVRYAEAARRHLLDSATLGIAVRFGSETRGILAAFTVLLRPPMRFMATARFSWASALSEPKLMAPVQKRFTISFADSTSSMGTACSS